MIIQLENVILISRNSETMLLYRLLPDYFGARTNFASAYPSPQTETWKQKKMENPSRKSEIAPRTRAKLDKGKAREENFQITITTPQIHNW